MGIESFHRRFGLALGVIFVVYRRTSLFRRIEGLLLCECLSFSVGAVRFPCIDEQHTMLPLSRHHTDSRRACLQFRPVQLLCLMMQPVSNTATGRGCVGVPG